MRTKYPLVAGVLALALGAVTALSGCGIKPGTVTTSFAPGSNPPPPQKVTRAGTYYLRPAGPGDLVTFYDLARGDEYGFKRRPDGAGAAFVVTGGKEVEIELPNRSGARYEWEYHKGTK